MKGIQAPGRNEKGGIRGERCPGTRAESRPGAPGPIHYPGPAGFRAWSHRGPLGWVGWLGEPNPGQWYLQCPPFPIEEGNCPRLEKKKGRSLTVISWGIVDHQCC